MLIRRFISEHNFIWQMVQREYSVNIRCDILLDNNKNCLHFESFHISYMKVDLVSGHVRVTRGAMSSFSATPVICYHHAAIS